MPKTFADQVMSDAFAAGCTHELAVAIMLHVSDAQNASALASAVAKSTAPAHVKRALLFNKTFKTDAQRIAAMQQASEVQYFVSMSGIPEHLRDIGKFTMRDAAGNLSLMPSAEVGRTIGNAMAEADVHIDTYRPDPGSRGAGHAGNEFDALAVEAFAAMAKARKEAAQ